MDQFEDAYFDADDLDGRDAVADYSPAGVADHAVTPEFPLDAGASLGSGIDMGTQGYLEAQRPAGDDPTQAPEVRFGASLCPHCNGTREWYGEVCGWCHGTGIY